MKVSIKDTENKDTGSITLPRQFEEEYRPDLITRAVLSLQSNARTPYGAKPGAGMRPSAELSRRRRKYRGSYGFGISRVPRKIMSRRGTRMNWIAALVSGAVGGRRAHPPKAEKVFAQKINKTENRKAIRSALAATMNKALVQARGHKVPEGYPFIISNDFEQITKTREIIAALVKIGLADELARSEVKTIRAGKGKVRGRKYKRKKGVLLVTSSEAKLELAARNIPGIDIVTVEELNAEELAPGTRPGRITLYTEDAIKRIADEKLFMQTYKAPAQEVEAKPAKSATKKGAKKTAEVSA